MSEQVTVRTDIRAAERLGQAYRAAAEVGMRRLAERAEQLVREEMPKKTHNLEQGVSSTVTVEGSRIRAEIVATARRGRRGARTGVLHEESGATKSVTLRPVPDYNYARAVAEGTGIYGPAGVAIKPKSAKALLIPVDSPPPALDGKPQAYIVADGQIYIVRPSMKGMKPNPYHERAAKRLQPEAQPIFDRALADVTGGKP